MQILIDTQPKTLTSILGEAEQLYVINNAILMQIFVKPETSTTTYDLTMTDVNDVVVFSETDCLGEFNHLVSIPVYGNLLLKVSNSSVDEDYVSLLSFRRK